MAETDPVTELTADEATLFLGAHRFGRLAVVLEGRPDVFPVNYALGDRTVYIRSAEGTKLFAALLGHEVAFEADEVADEEAVSVVAHGTPRVVEDPDERDAAEALGLHPWIATHKPRLIALDVSAITGRRFVFGPEPDGALTEPPD